MGRVDARAGGRDLGARQVRLAAVEERNAQVEPGEIEPRVQRQRLTECGGRRLELEPLEACDADIVRSIRLLDDGRGRHLPGGASRESDGHEPRRGNGTRDTPIRPGAHGSSTVNTRLTGTSVSSCTCPLGHRTSIRVMTVAAPSPTCRRVSLALS